MYNFEDDESLFGFGSDFKIIEFDNKSYNDSISESSSSLNKYLKYSIDIPDPPQNIPLPSSSETNISSEPVTLTKKKTKRGRKPDMMKSEEKDKNKKPHGKDKNDDKMTKIQRSFFNQFLINFLNLIMTLSGLNYKFVKLNGKYTGNIKKNFRESLNKKTIKEILNEAPIFGRNKEGLKENNKNVIKKLEEEGHNNILKIIEKKCLFFFENIYFNNLRLFNLNLFDLDSFEISIPKNIELFNDLLNRKDIKEDEKYKDALKNCARKYFFSRPEEI